MIAFLLTPIARWIAGAAAAALLLGGLYVKGRIDGTAACIVKNAIQVQKMEKYVKDLRERVIRNQPIGPDLLRDDPFIRPGE